MSLHKSFYAGPVHVEGHAEVHIFYILQDAIEGRREMASMIEGLTVGTLDLKVKMMRRTTRHVQRPRHSRIGRRTAPRTRTWTPWTPQRLSRTLALASR